MNIRLFPWLILSLLAAPALANIPIQQSPKPMVNQTAADSASAFHYPGKLVYRLTDTLRVPLNPLDSTKTISLERQRTVTVKFVISDAHVFQDCFQQVYGPGAPKVSTILWIFTDSIQPAADDRYQKISQAWLTVVHSLCWEACQEAFNSQPGPVIDPATPLPLECESEPVTIERPYGSFTITVRFYFKKIETNPPPAL